MEFDRMIGTTGVTADSFNLYVANNTNISVIAENGSIADYKHSYQNVTVLSMGQNVLYGIYSNGSAKGLFQMDVTTKIFRSVPVEYNPVFIYGLKNSATDVLVFDDAYQIYRYDASLAIKTRATPLPAQIKPFTYTTFVMTQANNTSYYATNDKIINLDTLEPIPLTIPGKIWGLHYYMDNLFIIYLSDYNQYSILQYNPLQQKVVKTVEGGLVSGPPLYSCIYKNNLLVSGTVNKTFPLTLFDLPGLIPNTNTTTNTMTNPNPYPLFELLENTPLYLDENVERKIEEIQTKTMTLEPDLKPAETAYMLTYLWWIVLLVLLGLFLWVVQVKETTMIHRIAFAIMIVSILFIFYRYI